MALPQAPAPQQPDLQVHPQDQGSGTVPLAPPELRPRVRVRVPWIAVVAILLTVAAAIYWMTLPNREKVEPLPTAVGMGKPG